MTKGQASYDGAQAEAQKKRRPREMPRSLRQREVNLIARSRCLLVLLVLSGEKTVSEAILEAGISRAMYYQLEGRALEAMLNALNPLAPAKGLEWPELSAAAQRIQVLERQVQRLGQAKRRSQRLLLLTRRALRGPVKTGRRGRRPKDALLGSIASGSTRSGLGKKPTFTLGSIPTKAGQSSP